MVRTSKSVIPLVVIGFIVIVFSLAVFFLIDNDKTTVHWWALAFLILSEVALFSGFVALRYIKATHSRLFIQTGISTSLILYFTATLTCVLFTGVFREKINVFILIHLAIIALFTIVIISISAFSRTIERQGYEDTKKVGVNEPKRGGF